VLLKRHCRGVLRSQNVPLRLDKGLREKYGLVRENWGYSKMEIVLERRKQDREEQK